MKNNTIATIALAGLILIAALVFMTPKTPAPKAGDNTSSYQYFGLGSETGVLCGTSTTQLIATSTGSRQSLKIYNDSSVGIYVSLGNAAVAHKGITIPASSGSMINLDNPTYMGAVNCISASTTVAASTTVEELK